MTTKTKPVLATPTEADLSLLLTQVRLIAQQAGEKILEVYVKADQGIETKADESPLTAADLASHHYIVDALNKLTPSYPILSEESASLDYKTRAAWETYWLVDPLDGTREFIKRNGEFSVLIALVHKNRPILGVVHAPVLNTSWYAATGLGAYQQQQEEIPVKLKTRQPQKILTVVGSRSHAGDSLKAFLSQLGDYELVSMGSILKACMVAEGRADLYPRLGPTSEWDTAAAQIIVEEAGGELLQIDTLQALTYNTKDSLLNPHFIVNGKTNPPWSDVCLKSTSKTNKVA